MANEREKILQAAQKFIDKRRYDKAIEEYQKIIKQDPKDARTLLKIGDLQARMQAYADAIATYDRVGQQYATQGFALKAIAVYKQVRELIKKHAPELADRYGHIAPRLAEIYTQLGLTGDALSAWDEVATRHQRSGRDREAIQVFEKMVDIDGNNPLPRLRLAEACCRVQDLDRAVDSFWSAAELLLKLERRDDALKVVERILHFRQDPRHARAAAELYLQRGTREDGLQALAKLQICFQANPKDLDTLALLAQAFGLIQAEAKATEVYKEMARIAREQGKTDLFQHLLAHLRSVAPDDEQVRALESLPVGTSMVPPSTSMAPESVSTSPTSTVSVSASQVEDAEIEIIDGDVGRGHEPTDVSVDEEAIAAEEVQSSHQSEFDTTGHLRKALVDAESFRRLRLYPKAIEALTIALELDPRAVEVRSELKKIYEEAGYAEVAGDESYNIATIHVDEGDLQTAAEWLYDALRLVPDHLAALELLDRLGVAAPQGWDYTTQQQPIPVNQSYDPQAPLPSYDLEEVGALHAIGATIDAVDDPFGESDAPLPSFPLGPEGEGFAYGEYPTATAQAGYDQRYASGAEGDVEPLANPQAGYEGQGYEGQGYDAQGYDAQGYDAQGYDAQGYDAQGYDAQGYDAQGYDAQGYDAQGYDAQGYARPGYDAQGYDAQGYDAQGYPQQGYPAAGYEGGYDAQGYPQPGYEGQVADGYAPPAYGDDEAATQYQPLPTAGAAEPSSDALEEALEEAEFFAARGLYEDAKAILHDQLARMPKHPLLLERLREIEQVSSTSGESGTIERSRLRGSRAPAPKANAFDVAASLGALDAVAPSAAPGTPLGTHDEIDVDQVFAQFKAGVKRQVAETDTATHYDLGVAYKEMMLLDDAIAEFELAARDPERECPCHAMIGMIQLEQGRLDAAEAAYKRGLDAPRKTVDQEMSLYYDLGIVMEMKQLPDEALYYFRRIARRDPGYRDVRDRIAELERGTGTQGQSGTRPVSDEDEFDAVFDELFESKK